MRNNRTWRQLAAVVIAVGLLLTPLNLRAQSNPDETYAKIKILSLVLNEIQKKYVEDTQPEDLIYGAIKGMLKTLDPHSSFMSPDEMKDFQIETKGSFTGVGIEITIKDDVLTVVSPIEGTPAFKAGVEAGDKIIKIDAKSTKDMTLMDAVRNIRGPKNSKVTLTIMRKGGTRPIKIPIIRTVIPLISVKKEVFENRYGYIRISNFQGDTADEVKKALRQLQSGNNPIQGLILDLRNNPGGLLDQSVQIADMFLDGGLVVYTKGKIEEQSMDFAADEETVAKDYPVVVLVNEGSASASEIVAGALQDQKRAIVVGAKTFGKGSVQTIIPLPDGSGLRLTTARYYTPLGRSIQAAGIDPDIVVASQFTRTGRILREKDLEKHLSGENEVDGSEEVDDEDIIDESEVNKNKKLISEMTYEERLEADPQLKKAIELLKTNQVLPMLKSARTNS